MKSLLLLTTALSILFALPVKAEVRLSKAQTFLKKNGSCYFAVGMYQAEAPATSDPNLAEEVFCVMDTVVAEGTVNEKSGCGLMIFNIATGDIRKATFNPMMPPAMVSPLILEGVKCKSGGFEKLLESKFESGYGAGPKAKELLAVGPMKRVAKTIVVHSDSSRAREAYDVAIMNLAHEQNQTQAATGRKTLREAKPKTTPASTHEKNHGVEGSWQQPCYEENGQHATSTMKFQAGKVTQSIVVYMDDACFRTAATFVSTGTYQLGQPLKAPPQARAIDISFNNLSLKPNSAEVASQFTGKTLHGKITWSAGVPQDISKSELGRKTIGKTFYTYFVLSGEKLLLPKSEDMEKATRSNRVDQPVDQAHPYLRSTE